MTQLYPQTLGWSRFAIEFGSCELTIPKQGHVRRIARTVKFPCSFFLSPLRQSYHSMWTHHAAQIALSAFVRKPDLIREDFVISGGKGGSIYKLTACHSHRIHVWHLYIYIYTGHPHLRFTIEINHGPNVGKYPEHGWYETSCLTNMSNYKK